MANSCDYEVRVKGSRKAGLMVYESMPCMDYKDFDDEERFGNSWLITFTGNCKWSVNYGVDDQLDKVDLNSMNESDIKDEGRNYWGYSLRAKSEAFQCEIMVHYWSPESGFDQFDHYKNGKVLKQRKIKYPCDEFDWDELEFVGHEGEYDESVDGEAQNENLMAMLLGLNDKLHSAQEPPISKEMAEKLDKLCKWTFTEGKIAKGDGWTIAIPDGFVQTGSKDVDPATGEKRLFELVPAAYKDENDVNVIPLRILPGSIHDGGGLGDSWMFHPNARAGMAGIHGIEFAQYMARTMLKAPRLMSTAWSDVAANILIQDTTGGSYSYMATVITEKKNQMLRVQTLCISDAHKQELNKSIIKWLHTMKFNKPNRVCPSKSKLEEASLYEEILKKGVTKKFDEAVEQAEIEYKASFMGKTEMMSYMCEYGLQEGNISDFIRETMTDSMVVREYYLEKADELIKKLQKAGIGQDVLNDMLKKLHFLDEDCTEFDLDDEIVKIKTPARVQEIRNEWKTLEKKLLKK